MNTTKTKNPIRDLLASVPPAMFLGNPPDTVAIWRTKIIEAGGDPDQALAWIREHGGYPDKSLPPAKRRGLPFSAYEDTRRFYVIPRSALS